MNTEYMHMVTKMCPPFFVLSYHTDLTSMLYACMSKSVSVMETHDVFITYNGNPTSVCI